MNNRWQMNRIGFVNFWLYDNEIFDLENGKVLIRGTNGSGKSITTQSIVSFILDGNRSPERLDTFGSSDRKMEYYFLGDDSEKTEGTGYIFLELKKRETEQYKTIGIGQKAQRGKPMQFWGFILSDGRRIGIDFELYKNIGSRRQVLDKKELERQLGEKNKFVEKPREYMEMINKELFGFTDINYYHKLIKFLLKIRTSKLSTGIKPANVHEILNDSLQILEGDDLNIIADSLEKMDEMQETNEKQKEARKILKNLKKEYDKYNKILLIEKAGNYLKAVDEYKYLDRKIKNIEKEIKNFEKFEKESTELKIQIEKRLEIIEQESRLLRNIDLERNVAELSNFQINLKNKEKDIISTENNLEECKHKFNKREAEKKVELNENEKIKNEIKEFYEEMTEINETISFYGHFKSEEEFFEKDIYSKFKTVKDNIEIYRDNIHSALEVLRKYKILSETLEKNEEEFSYLIKEKEKIQEENKNAEKLETEARDRLIEQFYVLKDDNEFLKISKGELEKIEELIVKYEGFLEREEIVKILEKNYNLKNQELSKQKIELDFEKRKTEKELEKEITELEKLKNRKETIPERTVEKEKCREELKKEEIPFISFYEAVDFSKDLTDEEKNILEAQLKESGILDSLIIPYSFKEKAEKIIKKYSDLILSVENNFNGAENFKKLIPEDIEAEFKETVEVFLKNITEKENENSYNGLILGENGYFKNGVLKGYASKNYTASFIGVQTRREKLKKDILNQEEKCGHIENELRNILILLEETETKLKVLNSEYKNIPQFTDLNTSIQLRKDSEYRLEKIISEAEEKEKKLLKIKNECRECDNKIIQNSKIFPFKRTIEEYEEGEGLAKEYIKILNRIESAARAYELSLSKIKSIENMQEKEEEFIEIYRDELMKNKNELEKIQNMIKKLEEIINSPENIAAAEKIKKLQTEQEDLKSQREEININMAGEKREYNLKKEQLEEYMKQESEKKDALEMTKEYFKEELDLKFIEVHGENLDGIAENISKSKEERKNITLQEAALSLNKTFLKYSDKFIEYMISLDDIFDSDPLYTRKRFIITMQREGIRISLYDFEKLLDEEIERREFAIEKEDRKLIEDVLSGNIGHKLIDYINESRKWIKEMSKIMQEMDTSMKMKFSMDWKAKSKAADSELEISELEVLLNKSNYLLSDEDLNKISQHFKSKLDYIREEIKNSEGELNYVDSIKKVLDYREWFEFKLYYQKHGENKKELTNSAFNKFSGGEKAMSIYIPLLAAASAQYKKAKEDCPRIIALDEAFAGIDDKNIDSMFELIEKLDFDYIMNSQILWGDCKSVKGLRIAELINKKELNMIVVNRFFWDGNKRYLVI